MKVLGLTGGIGMGKSTSDQLLRERGVPVVDTDQLAHQLVEPGQPALEEIKATFGDSIVGSDGRLQRSELAKIVFADETARWKLETILHPRIKSSWQSQIEIWRSEGRHVAVVVIPLLYETHAEKDFAAVICTACSGESQIQRLLKRGWNLEQIYQRIAAQLPIEQKMARAQFVIWTEGSLESHRAQLLRILPQV